MRIHYCANSELIIKSFYSKNKVRPASEFAPSVGQASTSSDCARGWFAHKLNGEIGASVYPAGIFYLLSRQDFICRITRGSAVAPLLLQLNWSAETSQATASQTFCRGIQRTDTHGRVTLESNYPGRYEGRTTHAHFEVYSGKKKVLPSQLAFSDNIHAIVCVQTPSHRSADTTSVKRSAADRAFSETPTTLTQALSRVAPNTATGGSIDSPTIGLLG